MGKHLYISSSRALGVKVFHLLRSQQGDIQQPHIYSLYGEFLLGALDFIFVKAISGLLFWNSLPKSVARGLVVNEYSDQWLP